MASILRVNTLTDASSGNSTAMSTINQGTAKAWSNVNGTGTIAINDSFNVSGVTDNSLGDITNTFSNAMSNTSYVMTISGGYVNDDGMARYSEATANWRTYYYNEGTRDAKDGSVNSSAIHGDLA
tara:strand:+ start:733 stop:1107 length:375 start_codon:yes stop_codon:yes gene_type:complete